MSQPASLMAGLNHALANPSHGVLGLVDELLTLSLEQDIRLAWQVGRCQVDMLDGDRPGRIDVTLPKSVVRAVLARIASLCNERNPNLVSPYGGQGEVLADSKIARAIRVNFVNTPEQQTLELASVRLGANRPVGDHSSSAIV
jgi:hypothetical protein